MTGRAIVLTLAFAFVTGGAGPVEAQSAADLLKAPVVKRRLEIRQASAPGDPAKIVFWIIRDDNAPEVLTSGTTLVTPRNLGIYIDRFNPLRIQVGAEVEDRVDETSAKISELMASIAGIPGIVVPKKDQKLDTPATSLPVPALFGLPLAAAAADDPCLPRVNRFFEIMDLLDKYLTQPDAEPAKLKAAVVAWQDNIDTVGGAQGVLKTRAAIGEAALKFKKTAESALPIIDEIEKHLETPVTDACGWLVFRGYQVIQRTEPRSRVTRLLSLAGALSSLADGLKTFENGFWEGRSYMVAAVTAETGKVKKVTLKVAPIEIQTGDASVATKVGKAESTVMEFRRESFLVPEVGAGWVVSNLAKPKYGTAVDPVSGKTIVTATGTEDKSFDAALVMNFLMRTNSGPVVPMLQIGTAVDKDVPTILAGGGLRILGAKGVALGGGWALAWARELDPAKLKPGDPVTGTSQIEESLKHKFQGFKHWYFTIQYNF